MKQHPIYDWIWCDDMGVLYSSLTKRKSNQGFFYDDTGTPSYRYHTNSNNMGYHQISITRDGVEVKRLYHRIVWECINGREIQRGYVIDHIDRNKNNNHPTNLREVTISVNVDNISEVNKIKRKVSLLSGCRKAANNRKRKVTLRKGGSCIEVNGIKGFCNENGLCRQKFYKLLSGEMEEYNGYTLYK